MSIRPNIDLIELCGTVQKIMCRKPSKGHPVSRLNVMFRQGIDSLITVKAHKVHFDDVPFPGQGEDFGIITRPDSAGFYLEMIERLNLNELHGPMLRGTDGCTNLNTSITHQARSHFQHCRRLRRLPITRLGTGLTTR